jgi:hypothetical protein
MKDFKITEILSEFKEIGKTLMLIKTTFKFGKKSSEN